MAPKQPQQSDSETDSQDDSTSSDSQPQQSDSEIDSQDDSTSSDDSDSQPQQLTQTKPHQQSQDSSDSESDSEEAQKPLSPEPTLKPTQLKPNGKRPAEVELIDKVSKKSKGADKVVDKAEKVVDKASKIDEKVDKGKSVHKGKSVDKGNLDEEGGEIEDKKGGLFARLFTEKDEILLLEGMITFKEKNGSDPSLNIVAFHQSVEELLSCSVTKTQIANKIKRLKKKFVNNSNKGRNGEDPVFSRPHEFKSFELSKQIWASEVSGSEVNADKKDENVGKKEEETEDLWLLYPFLCASLESEARQNFIAPVSPKKIVKKVVSGLNKEKATELEQEWKGFSLMEHQLYVKRAAMISKQAEASMKVIQP